MKTENVDFMNHLYQSQALVRSWPDWKKNIWPENLDIPSDDKIAEKPATKQVSLVHQLLCK